MPRHIRTYIRFYSILLATLPTALVLCLAFFLLRGVVVEKEVARIKQHVTYQQEYVQSWLDGLRSNGAFLAGDIAVRQGDISAMQTVFERFLAANSMVAAVIRVNADGISTLDSSSPAGLSLGDREYFQAARGGKPWVSDVLIARNTGELILIFSHPVQTMQGDFGGVVLLSVRISTVQAFLNIVSDSEKGESYLLNRGGEMFTESHYRHRQKLLQQGASASGDTITVTSSLYKAAVQDAVFKGAYANYQGREVVGASAWVNDGRWLLVTEVPLDEVLRSFYSFLWLVVAISVFSLLILAPVLLRFSYSIERPINGIVSFAKSMAKGEYDQKCALPDVEGAPEEIVLLFDTFCEMNEKVVSTIEALELSSITDQLTGVRNRRHMMEAGEQIINICMRSGTPCCCLMLDIDHFKSVNDTYGHAAGDMVLIAIAKIISESVRSSDLVVRYGGEEFAVIAPNSDRKMGAALAERIRIAVSEYKHHADNVRFTCTISVGVSAVNPAMATGASILERALNCADQALYTAKREGRNRVATYEGC